MEVRPSGHLDLNTDESIFAASGGAIEGEDSALGISGVAGISRIISVSSSILVGEIQW